MIALRVQPLDEKRVRISGIPPVLAAMLHELPEILELRDSPEAQQRLYPSPTAKDENINKEWAQVTSPELHHLFVSAGETVARDLTALALQTELFKRAGAPPATVTPELVQRYYDEHRARYGELPPDVLERVRGGEGHAHVGRTDLLFVKGGEY